MNDKDWTRLNKRFSRAVLNDLPRVIQTDLTSFMKVGGFEYRTEGDYVFLRASSSNAPFVSATPLHTANGTLRPEARDILTTGGVDMDPGVREVLSLSQKSGGLDVTPVNQLQFLLFTQTDVLPLLEPLVAKGHQVYRVQGLMRLYARQRTLTLLEDLVSGTPPSQLRKGTRRIPSTVISSAWMAMPASLMCFPLLARWQPLAQVVKTMSGAELVVLPPNGESYWRPSQMTTWPVGTVGASLHGPGRGMYRGVPKLFQGAQTEQLFDECVGASNVLLAWLTDPARWRTHTGGFNVSEHWILWASVVQAIQSLMNIAEDWVRAETVWTAFRALGILQGIWQGHHTGSVQMRELLRPHRLKEHAVPSLSNAPLRNWASAVIGNWEAEIARGFPGKSEESAVTSLQELRNLVHGVGAPNPERATRLNVLRQVEEYEPNLQFIVDVAVIWWTAALFKPSTLLVTGSPPWKL